MRMTKREAAVSMIEAAIRMWSDPRNEACVIVLAKAAEGCLPKDRPAMFDYLKRGLAKISEKANNQEPPSDDAIAKANDRLNFQADWLRHPTHKYPDEIQLSDGSLMISRAIHRFGTVFGSDQWTPAMREFRGLHLIFEPSASTPGKSGSREL